MQAGISRLRMLGAVAGNEDGRRRVDAQLKSVETTVTNAVTVLDAYIACELQHCLRVRRAGMSTYGQGLQSTCGIWNLCEPGIDHPASMMAMWPRNHSKLLRAVCMSWDIMRHTAGGQLSFKARKFVRSWKFLDLHQTPGCYFVYGTSPECSDVKTLIYQRQQGFWIHFCQADGSCVMNKDASFEHECVEILYLQVHKARQPR